jgi:hypothetical protein
MDFQSYIVVSFCVQRLKVGGDCFVDIGGIDDYYWGYRRDILSSTQLS